VSYLMCGINSIFWNEFPFLKFETPSVLSSLDLWMSVIMCASKRSRDISDENVQMKKRCLWFPDVEEEDEEENREGGGEEINEKESEDENMEEEGLPNINEIKLNGLPIDGIYPRKPKFGRKIDNLIDDIIRKSQRHTENQNSYALIPTPDTTIWIPSSIGPHPATDQRYLSRSHNPPFPTHEIEAVETQPQSRNESNTTHSDWFVFANDGQDPLPSPLWRRSSSSSLKEDSSSSSPSSSSDECEDMAVIP
jgi:hypothetical protein